MIHENTGHPAAALEMNGSCSGASGFWKAKHFFGLSHMYLGSVTVGRSF